MGGAQREALKLGGSSKVRDELTEAQLDKQSWTAQHCLLRRAAGAGPGLARDRADGRLL